MQKTGIQVALLIGGVLAAIGLFLAGFAPSISALICTLGITLGLYRENIFHKVKAMCSKVITKCVHIELACILHLLSHNTIYKYFHQD